MMGRKHREQASLFYEFRLDDMVSKGHLLRRINVFVTSALGDLHKELGRFYSDIGRHSIDPERLIRMLIVGCCYGIRSERKLCEEVRLVARRAKACRDAPPALENLPWLPANAAQGTFRRAMNSTSPPLCTTLKLSRCAPSGGHQSGSAHRSPEPSLQFRTASTASNCC